MIWQVLIAHAEGEEALAAQLAEPIRRAGYDVAHRGTVMIGESVTEEASRVLNSGGPVVLCGTIKALGTGWAHRLINAANAARQNQRVRVFVIQMEKDAYVHQLSLDDNIAIYWQNPIKALQDLVASLQKHFPIIQADSLLQRGDLSFRDMTVRDLGCHLYEWKIVHTNAQKLWVSIPKDQIRRINERSTDGDIDRLIRDWEQYCGDKIREINRSFKSFTYIHNRSIE